MSETAKDTLHRIIGILTAILTGVMTFMVTDMYKDFKQSLKDTDRNSQKIEQLAQGQADHEGRLRYIEHNSSISNYNSNKNSNIKTVNEN
jgi:hypothetical protein